MLFALLLFASAPPPSPHHPAPLAWLSLPAPVASWSPSDAPRPQGCGPVERGTTYAAWHRCFVSADPKRPFMGWLHEVRAANGDFYDGFAHVEPRGFEVLSTRTARTKAGVEIGIVETKPAADIFATLLLVPHGDVAALVIVAFSTRAPGASEPERARIVAGLVDDLRTSDTSGAAGAPDVAPDVAPMITDLVDVLSCSRWPTGNAPQSDWITSGSARIPAPPFSLSDPPGDEPGKATANASNFACRAKRRPNDVRVLTGHAHFLRLRGLVDASIAVWKSCASSECNAQRALVLADTDRAAEAAPLLGVREMSGDDRVAGMLRRAQALAALASRSADAARLARIVGATAGWGAEGRALEACALLQQNEPADALRVLAQDDAMTAAGAVYRARALAALGRADEARRFLSEIHGDVVRAAYAAPHLGHAHLLAAETAAAAGRADVAAAHRGLAGKLLVSTDPCH